MRTMHLALLLALLTLLSTRALCQVYEAPKDTNAVLIAVDQDYFYNDGQYFTTAAQNQRYSTQGHQYIQYSPDLNDGTDLQTFLNEWKDAGLIHISSDGNTGDGFMFKAYPYTPDGRQAAINMANVYTGQKGFDPAEIKIYSYGGGRGYGLFLTKYGVQQRFKCDNNPIVMLNVCCGSTYSADIASNGARFVLANPGTIASGNSSTSGTALYNANTFWRRLDGQDGIDYRYCTKAKEGLVDVDPTTHQSSALVGSGNGSTVLGPYTLSCSVGNSISVSSMSQTVTMKFSCNIETNPHPGLPWFLITPNPGDANVTRYTISGNVLTFYIQGVREGNFSIDIAPRSDDTLHVFDGNQTPANSNGKGPCGDAYHISGYSSYNDHNWAAVFSRVSAFTDIEGTHVICVTAFEAGTESLTVYAGHHRDQLLTTTPASGSTDHPRFYEWVFPTADSAYEVVEVDDDLSYDYASRPFTLTSIPADIDSLRGINMQRNAPQMPPPYLLGQNCQQYGMCSDPPPPAPQVVDYVFASTRDSFLNQQYVVQLKNYYRGMGLVVKDTLLATHNPAALKNYFWSVWLADSLAHHRRPVLWLLGFCNQDSTKDFCPTFWFSDPTGQMWPAITPNDQMYSSFASDSLPRTVVVRLQGSTATEVGFSALSTLKMDQNKYLVQHGVMLLNGNVANCGEFYPEPTMTLLNHWNEFTGTVEMLSDSSFVCDDYMGRAYAFARRFVQFAVPNVTEVHGTGWYTAQTIFPGFFAQQVASPGMFSIEYFRALGIPSQWAAVLPGCSQGDLDEYQSYWSIGRLLLGSDPNRYSTAAAIIGPSRPNIQTYHQRLLDLELANRNSGRYATIQDAFLDAELQLVQEQPGAKWYVWSMVFSGGLVSYPDMLPLTGAQAPDGRSAIDLSLPFPNPAHDRATISYSLDVTRPVRLSVYNVAGRQVQLLVDGTQSAGPHTFTWNTHEAGHAIPSGVYFLRLDTGSAHITHKVMVVR